MAKPKLGIITQDNKDFWLAKYNEAIAAIEFIVNAEPVKESQEAEFYAEYAQRFLEQSRDFFVALKVWNEQL